MTREQPGIRGEQTRRPMQLRMIGIDLGKTVFHLVGLDLRDEVVAQEVFARATAALHGET